MGQMRDQLLREFPGSTDAVRRCNLSPAEAVVDPFRKAADVSKQDAMRLIENPEHPKVAGHKRAAFMAAVIADENVGTIENLRTRVKAAKSGGPKLA